MGKIAQTAICSFNDCLRSVSAKGLCKPHYEQRRRGNQLKPLLETLSTTCVMDGCERTVHVKTRQLCRYHYQRLIRGYGELLPRPCEVCENSFRVAIAMLDFAQMAVQSHLLDGCASTD